MRDVGFRYRNRVQECRQTLADESAARSVATLGCAEHMELRKSKAKSPTIRFRPHEQSRFFLATVRSSDE
jgi:hypothetical protein